VSFTVPWLIMWRSWRAEMRRRSVGETPSWPAQLPVMVARQYGLTGSGRRSRQMDIGERVGRLTYFGDGLRWDPREADRKRGMGSITWDRSWSLEVVPLWGPGHQGCLTLTAADGAAIDLWVRHPQNLRRMLGLVDIP
jgi:hypothetical protein